MRLLHIPWNYHLNVFIDRCNYIKHLISELFEEKIFSAEMFGIFNLNAEVYFLHVITNNEEKQDMNKRE